MQGSPSFDDFFDLFLQLADGLWWLDERCSGWRNYSSWHPKHASRIENLVVQWYGLRVEKGGSNTTKGFLSKDLRAIIARLKELLPEPPKPKLEEVVIRKPVIIQRLTVSKPSPLLDTQPQTQPPSSNLTPPKRLSQMAPTSRKRWVKKLKEAGVDPSQFM